MSKRIFVHQRIVSAVKRTEFVSDRMSYIVPRGHWCHIVLHPHTSTEGKSDDSKGQILCDIGAGFCSFSKGQYEILL